MAPGDPVPDLWPPGCSRESLCGDVSRPPRAISDWTVGGHPFGRGLGLYILPKRPKSLIKVGLNAGERERRLEQRLTGGESPRAIQAIRGHITRELIEELRPMGPESPNVFMALGTLVAGGDHPDIEYRSIARAHR